MCMTTVVIRNLRTVVSVPDLQQSKRIWASHRPGRGEYGVFLPKILCSFQCLCLQIVHIMLSIYLVLRSASVTNLALDRSTSSMVPAYETTVSPQNSRAQPKNDHSEEERKILLVRTVSHQVLLNFP